MSERPGSSPPEPINFLERYQRGKASREKGTRVPKLTRWPTATIGVCLGLILAAAVTRPWERWQASEQTPELHPISGPAVPGESAVGEEEKQETPIELTLFMRVKRFQDWVNSLPEETSVRVAFSREGFSGFVDDPDGANRRALPTTQSFKYLNGIPAGAAVGTRGNPPRFIVTITSPDRDSSEEWIGHGEATWLDANDLKRYDLMDFSAIRTPKDGVIIKMLREPQNTVRVDFPRTN